MRIHLAESSHIADLAMIDVAPGQWSEAKILSFIDSEGVVKMASEGVWVVGWIACKLRGRLLTIERLAVDEPLTAKRLLNHVIAAYRAEAADLDLPDTQLEIVEELVRDKWVSVLIKDFYGRHQDAIALHWRRPPPNAMA